MMTLLLALQPKEVLDAGAAAATTLTQTVLGSLVVILLILLGLLGWIIVRAKNDHLADKDAMRKEMLGQALRNQELAEVTNKSNDAVVHALRDLRDDVTDAVREMQDLRVHMGKVEGALTDVGIAARGSCRGAEDAAANVDALAMAIPGVDRDKYYLATKRTKGGP